MMLCKELLFGVRQLVAAFNSLKESLRAPAIQSADKSAHSKASTPERRHTRGRQAAFPRR